VGSEADRTPPPSAGGVAIRSRVLRKLLLRTGSVIRPNLTRIVRTRFPVFLEADGRSADDYRCTHRFFLSLRKGLIAYSAARTAASAG
jgi:hypothetical protein